MNWLKQPMPAPRWHHSFLAIWSARVPITTDTLGSSCQSIEAKTAMSGEILTTSGTNLLANSPVDRDIKAEED